jgi:acyl-coenzyme A thioesterase PaaI-like protein
MTNPISLALPPAFVSAAKDTAASTAWTFAETAAGPFGSVFGGIVAAAMVEQALSIAPEHGMVASVAVDFLRPTGLSEAVTQAELAHSGRRTAFVEVALRQDGQVAARARVLLAAPLAIGGLPASDWAAPTLATPEDLPAAPRPRPRFTKTWSGDLLDSRVDLGAGVRWVRRRDERQLPLSSGAFAVAMADYAAGFSRPDSWQEPVVKGFPNPNLSVSLVREPRGPWVGLRPRSVWDASGLAASHADLIDRDGAFGLAVVTSLLMPFTPDELAEQGAWAPE